MLRTLCRFAPTADSPRLRTPFRLNFSALNLNSNEAGAMKLAEIDSDEDAVFDASREHTNHEDGGYCCPHCLKNNKHLPETERTAVICDHCGEAFVVWQETETRNCSGPLAA
jgi:hypothetical protein